MNAFKRTFTTLSSKAIVALVVLSLALSPSAAAQPARGPVVEAIVQASDQRRAVGREHEIGDKPGAGPERVEPLAARHVPQERGARAIPRGRDQHRTIRRKEQLAPLPLNRAVDQRAHLRPSRHVPQEHRPIVKPGGQHHSIR